MKMSSDERVDKGMMEKGYKYKIIFISGKCLPLYAKALMDIGPIFRDWPNERFNVVHLESKEVRLYNVEERDK